MNRPINVPLILLLGILLLSVSPALGQQTIQGVEDKTTGWRKITSQEHGFEALFPSQVTLKRDSSSDDMGTYPIAAFQADAPAGVFMVVAQGMSNRIDALSKELATQDKGLVFQRIFDEAEKVVFDDIPDFVTAVKVGETSFAGNPARSYNMMAMGNKIGEARLTQNGSNVIVLMAVDLGERSESNVRLFFSSVRFF